MVRYEIRKGKNAPCELWSLVKNKDDMFHGPYFVHENFVCEGTYTYCASVKEKLEG